MPNSLPWPSTQHQGNTTTCIEVEAVVNRMQCCEDMAGLRFELSTSLTQGNCLAMEVVKSVIRNHIKIYKQLAMGNFS